MKDSRTQKYRSTKTTHTLSWLKQSSCFSTTHCSSKLVCLCSTQSLPSVLLQCLTCSWLDSTLFLTEISGKADSLHIGFISDWELYFHKNYDFLVHPRVSKRKQINLNNRILSNWFSDAFSLPQQSPALSVWSTFAQIPALMILLCGHSFFQWNAPALLMSQSQSSEKQTGVTWVLLTPCILANTSFKSNKESTQCASTLMGQCSPLLFRAQGEDLFPSPDTLSPWGDAELHPPSLSPCSDEAISDHTCGHLWSQGSCSKIRVNSWRGSHGSGYWSPPLNEMGTLHLSTKKVVCSQKLLFLSLAAEFGYLSYGTLSPISDASFVFRPKLGQLWANYMAKGFYRVKKVGPVWKLLWNLFLF